MRQLGKGPQITVNGTLSLELTQDERQRAPVPKAINLDAKRRKPQNQQASNRLRKTDGEGNGKSLQYSCLENPMDGGAW